MIVRVIYEDGVFRPEAPVQLEQGVRGEVILKATPTYWTPQEVARAIHDIAATTADDDQDFSGEDHDQVLYGDNDGT